MAPAFECLFFVHTSYAIDAAHLLLVSSVID